MTRTNLNSAEFDYLRSLTQSQLYRLSQQLHDRMSGRHHGEYARYGIDRRTMALTRPHMLAALDEIERIIESGQYRRTLNCWCVANDCPIESKGGRSAVFIVDNVRPECVRELFWLDDYKVSSVAGIVIYLNKVEG